MEEFNLSIKKAFLLVAGYLGIMIFYTFLDVAVWRKIFPSISNWLNIVTIVICICVFIGLLYKTGYKICLFSNISAPGILLASACIAFFYLILDNCLDPVLENIFPASEQSYQESIRILIASPVTSFLQICIIAPVIEEILMRGVVLGGLKKHNVKAALIISAVLFSLLHFNMVQTLSAFICGIFLGLLYIKTESILCCMITHCGYNMLSYAVMIYPFIKMG